MPHNLRGRHRGSAYTDRCVGLDRAVRHWWLLPSIVATAAGAGTAGAMAAGAGTAGAVSSLALPSLSTLALTTSLAGTGLSTFAQIQQTRAMAAASQVNKAAAQREADVARQNAAFEEQQFRRRVGFLLGKQEAVGAASGLDITSGSSLFAELDNIQQAELEALNIRRGGALSSSSKLYDSRLATIQARRFQRSIPGIYAGGFAQSGSILSQLFR